MYFFLLMGRGCQPRNNVSCGVERVWFLEENYKIVLEENYKIVRALVVWVFNYRANPQWGKLLGDVGTKFSTVKKPRSIRGHDRRCKACCLTTASVFIVLQPVCGSFNLAVVIKMREGKWHSTTESHQVLDRRPPRKPLQWKAMEKHLCSSLPLKAPLLGLP